MKETAIVQKDTVENVKQVEVQKQLKLVSRFRPHKGHTLFEVNTVTREVKKAEFEIEKEIGFDKAKRLNMPVPSKKVIKKDNCIYVSALNIQNCFKKLGFVVKK